MRILIVDDEKDIQALFEQRFRKEIKNNELELAFAYSGEEALSYLTEKEQHAILILSDINMPGMSGLDLLAKIKQKYSQPPPMVMMITAYGDEENYNTAMKLGADDFLTKPLDFNQLKEKLIPLNMTKILVVDDEADLEILIKQKFRQKIRQQEYEFVFAVNGQDALDKLLENQDLDLVLSDINMPVMDGLTLLSKLSEQNSLLKSVIISAYGDMDNIRTAMNRGAFDFITKPVDFNDLEITIEKTIRHVRQIKETLQAIRENNILRMYVDENVLNFMHSREFESSLLANENMEGTVAFIDICGFTAISETEPADKVVGLLNEYFDIMVKEIIQEKGIIDKFIGDAIMAVFKGPFHLDRAVDACLAIRNTIDALPLAIGNSGFKPHVSIGINSGEMVTGNIGSSTLRRLDHTVIGDAVNIAARLQAAAGVSQILITETNYKLIKESFVCEKVGDMQFKNKESKIMVYEVKS